jgi:hypothetical protein
MNGLQADFGLESWMAGLFSKRYKALFFSWLHKIDNYRVLSRLTADGFALMRFLRVWLIKRAP